MMLKESVLRLNDGDQVRLKDSNGTTATLQVYMGDALLNGDDHQVWLKGRQDSSSVFLRKTPQDSRSVGFALFRSLSELANTIESAQFYIG